MALFPDIYILQHESISNESLFYVKFLTNEKVNALALDIEITYETSPELAALIIKCMIFTFQLLHISFGFIFAYGCYVDCFCVLKGMHVYKGSYNLDYN